MGLYNMIFGRNKDEEILKKVLGLDPDTSDLDWWPASPFDEAKRWSPASYEGFDRLSDAEQKCFTERCIEEKIWITGRFRDISCNGDRIVVTTRNGGGNRHGHRYVFDILRHHPNYIEDEDDTFDNTYADIVFSVPEQHKELCRSLAEGDYRTVAEKFALFLNSLENETVDSTFIQELRKE